MARSAQFPDLKPIERLWVDVKKYVAEKQLSNAEYVKTIVLGAWHQRPYKAKSAGSHTVVHLGNTALQNDNDDGTMKTDW